MQVKLVLAEQSDKEEEHDAQLLRRLSTRQTSSAALHETNINLSLNLHKKDLLKGGCLDELIF